MSDRQRATAVPRWVWICALAALALVLTAVIVMLAAEPGQHGPEQHTTGDDPADQEPRVQG